MAGLLFSATTDDISLTATTAKTCVQAGAAANHRVKLLGLSVSFKGVNPIGTPAEVELVRQTNAGTMSALTPLADDESIPETIQTTCKHTATAEPTGSTVIWRRKVHPQGLYEFRFPYGQEKIIKGAGFLGMRVTAPEAVDVVCELNCEE